MFRLFGPKFAPKNLSAVQPSVFSTAKNFLRDSTRIFFIDSSSNSIITELAVFLVYIFFLWKIYKSLYTGRRNTFRDYQGAGQPTDFDLDHELILSNSEQLDSLIVMYT